MKQYKLYLGDNMVSLKKLPDNSIDSVVTDGPYGLSFMNKKWDYDVPSVEFWQEVYRVLKPGGHILSFGGTRTYHRMVVNIEDAGFEIRDQIMWIYGSGFPKSLNIGKAIQKSTGEIKVIGKKIQRVDGTLRNTQPNGGFMKDNITTKKGDGYIDVIQIDNEYEGWGTALKPANEPICVARKPISEKTIAENVIKWGTGGINIDGCRIGNDMISSGKTKVVNGGQLNGENTRVNIEETFSEGRFPANLIFECCCDEVIKGDKGEVIENKPRNKRFDPTQHNSNKIYESSEGFTTNTYTDTGDIHTDQNCPCYQLDQQSGISKSAGGKKDLTITSNNNPSKITTNIKSGNHFGDKGGASRFFYVAKVSKKERNLGLDTKNSHPTLKPINLLTYLVRLITPQNGICLDPFMGSGSTGIAAMLEGFRFVGCEMDEDYFKIAEKRIESFEEYKKIIKK